LSWLKQSWTWLKWPFALGLLGFLYHQNREGLHQLQGQPKNWWLLLVAFGLIFGSTLLTFWRWFLLVWAQGFEFRFRDALRLGFLGLVFNYISPGSVGGDLFKAIFLAREHATRRTVAVATVVLDRILGLLALFMVGAVASLLPVDIVWTKDLETVRWLLWLGSTAGVVGLSLMLHPGLTRGKWLHGLTRLPLVGRPFGELLHGVMLYQSRPGAVIAALAISLFGHAGFILGFYCCARALLSWSPDLVSHLFFMPMAETVGAIPITPGGLGTLEEAVKWFYERLATAADSGQVAAAGGLLATLAFRFVGLFVTAIGGVYYLTARKEIASAMQDIARSVEHDTTHRKPLHRSSVEVTPSPYPDVTQNAEARS
jgi:uncharacterized membrane protein YbhN (UPF0104 family)